MNLMIQFYIINWNYRQALDILHPASGTLKKPRHRSRIGHGRLPAMFRLQRNGFEWTALSVWRVIGCEYLPPSG
jgi:hypothetical protein